MVSSKFIKQTEQLEYTTTEMGQNLLRGLSLCKHALFDNDKTLIPEINELHEDVAASARECEQLCVRIMLLQHPVARDLRRITAVTNVTRDMTRIIDQENEIAGLISYIQNDKTVIDDKLKDFFSVAKNMICKAVEAFVQNDDKKANEVIKMDDEADALYKKVKEIYIDKLSSKEWESESLVDLLLVGKYLERICDHAARMGGWVIYQKTAIFSDDK